MIRKRKTTKNRGLIVPLILAAVSIFLAVLTIVIDGGIMLLAHSELQGLAEISALTAASAGTSTEAASNSVDRFLEKNGFSTCTTKVMVDGNKVSVHVERRVDLLLSRRLGRSAVYLRGAASAVRQDGLVRLLP